MKEAIGQFSANFLEKTKKDGVNIISHFDTDGITSAAIVVKTLKKLDIAFSLKIVKNLEKEIITDLEKNKPVLFLDLASNSLDIISESNFKEVFIVDHHEIIQELPREINIVNPQLYNKEQISTSGLAYLFCKELCKDSIDLEKLAVLGMIGDQLEKNIDKLNNHILSTGEILKKRGLLLYPSTRPINRVLEYSSNPIIPGATGDTKGTIELLRAVGIKPKNGVYPSLIELTEEDMTKLTTEILLRKPKNNRKDSLVGDIFLIKMFNKLEDARELSAMINACSRLDESGVALQVCLEIPSAKKRADSIHIKYKRHIISALEYANNAEKIEGDNYVLINAKDNIKDTIVGTTASILANSSVYETGTIIITMAYNTEEKIKISARVVGKQGRNLREMLNSIISPIGGEVGGHEFAAGGLILKEKEEEFISSLKRNLEVEMIKVVN